MNIPQHTKRYHVFFVISNHIVQFFPVVALTPFSAMRKICEHSLIGHEGLYDYVIVGEQ